MERERERADLIMRFNRLSIINYRLSIINDCGPPLTCGLRQTLNNINPRRICSHSPILSCPIISLLSPLISLFTSPFIHLSIYPFIHWFIPSQYHAIVTSEGTFFAYLKLLPTASQRHLSPTFYCRPTHPPYRSKSNDEKRIGEKVENNEE